MCFNFHSSFGTLKLVLIHLRAHLTQDGDPRAQEQACRLRKVQGAPHHTPPRGRHHTTPAPSPPPTPQCFVGLLCRDKRFARFVLCAVRLGDVLHQRREPARSSPHDCRPAHPGPRSCART
ncbi:hypothetical protein BV25DRAFT_353504 [Artomyces pyxidatus]|uniref:Uncharacterized protein n=1 Tax=Artomyces pyxidatus TaxID=48021 RepID=A0ACB8T6G2_9AGAM|nr:hypothetical protein BV25DRAFT_353504 [Artomyces pyxidatus]